MRVARLLMLIVIALPWAMSLRGEVPHVYVYRNDSAFHYLDGRDVLQISYDGNEAEGVRAMRIVATDSTETVVAMEAIDSVRMSTSAIPDFYFDLLDEPELEELVQSRGKEYIYRATMRMEGNGSYEDIDEQEVEFRGRGNSTWHMPKKPYRFKMAKKRGVCGLRKAKTFALLANFIDCTHMRNFVALKLAELLELPYSNHAVPVRVFMNGRLKGLYMLTEKIGIGGGSVDIDEEKGMLFELDTAMDEDYKFAYEWTEGGKDRKLTVMVKDPDIAEVAEALGVEPEEYWDRWQADFMAFADTISSAGLDADLSVVLDLNSAVDFMMVNNLALNEELNHPKSVYLYKDSIEGVYHFGPVWDFDWSFTFDGGYATKTARRQLMTWDGTMNGATFLRHIVRNRKFQELYAERWKQFKAEFYPALLASMDEYAVLIEAAAKEDGLLWAGAMAEYKQGTVPSYHHRERVEELKAWIAERVRYISGAVNFGLAPSR
ncbi:MAG: CotH kinase family protein [Muribaculaceae bacterium]|nr:CotH kinase family protein [Muribaculaceae bacterium]